MRVGVFGGTFDPVHIGHLILAEQAREQARLDAVWFVPAARPPHKVALARFEQRVEMLNLALAGNPAFRIDELEKERAGFSYTVDTVIELRRRHPGDEFFLVVGSDTLDDLHHWHEPVRLLGQAGLVVTARPGYAIPDAAELARRLGLPESAPLCLQFVEAPQVEISSHELRRRAAAGRSLRYLLPRAVECYILDKHLYRSDP
jgi:nicotinate-nucleotide adenylyltransferase